MIYKISICIFTYESEKEKKAIKKNPTELTIGFVEFVKIILIVS
tara:strand:+ start:7978 stop:8109 length:132 start_codon:yes stop_codon:yes gene_type:complete